MKRISIVITLLLLAGGLSNKGYAEEGRVDNSTLHKKIMCGYQGWFRAEGDGADQAWQHYGKRGRDFKPGSCTIEFWPHTAELDAEEKYATSFKHADGSPAYVYSAYDRKSVLLHFKWMQEYGIDGVFVQRFARSLAEDNRQSKHGFKIKNEILKYCREGANMYGRTYAVMYDLTRLPANCADLVIADWKEMVDEVGLFNEEDNAYQYHNGKPVVSIWGLGLDDGRRAYTVEDLTKLIGFLKNDPKYGGCTVKLGTSTGWRTLDRDTQPDPRWHDVYRQADIISPWMPGRLRFSSEVRIHTESDWIPDMKWCAENGLEYMPVVYPGFGWVNMQNMPSADISRQDGRFLWEQYRCLVNAGATMIYQAMFDEIDEGTQICKIDNNPPVTKKTTFLTYEPLPEDHYLWLVGEAGRMLRGEIPVTPSQPARAEFDEVNRYLAEGDDAFFKTMETRYDTGLLLRDIQFGLRRSDGLLVAEPAHARVELHGKWHEGLWSPSRKTNWLVWSENIPKGGTYRVDVCFPEDVHSNRATRARLVLEHAGGKTTRRLNLNKDWLQWIPLGEFEFSRGWNRTELFGSWFGGNISIVALRFVPVD